MSEPIMNDWYKWAELFNKFAAWATIGLGVLWWILAGIHWTGYNPKVLVFDYFLGLYYLITGVAAGILYFIFVYKPVANKDQTKKTHIWLIICTVLGAPEIFIPLVFLFYAILSDVPFWKAFSSKSE